MGQEPGGLEHFGHMLIALSVGTPGGLFVQLIVFLRQGAHHRIHRAVVSL